MAERCDGGGGGGGSRRGRLQAAAPRQVLPSIEEKLNHSPVFSSWVAAVRGDSSVSQEYAMAGVGTR
ncbi:hypothetical protein E2C01_088978 [Portunus trituberculatus]|uniref:Uncharacterized protein n=1 Tax=Portunus trituberculatus TaxID=210409 RepID=A0A5B7JHI1_PORTR|nr:hypothetical protein [Portunus trituberculatus]